MAYTYLIKCIPEDKVYYGVRYAKGCSTEDLWNTYFTSSKKVRDLVLKYGTDAFEYEIRKTFDSVECARQWENRVLHKMRVVVDDRFINSTDNKSIDPKDAAKSGAKRKGILHPNFGKPNKYLAQYNRDHPKVGVDNWMYGRIGSDNPNYGKRGKLSPIYGRKRPELSITVTCPHCLKEGGVSGMRRWHFSKCQNYPIQQKEGTN